MTLASLLANDIPVAPPWHATTFIESVVATAVFGLLGLAILFLGYKVFDWLTPHLHIEKELAEKNMAVAIVIATMLLSLSVIVAKSFG
jgi:putative membrane protein